MRGAALHHRILILSIHGIFHARVLEWGAIAFSVKSLRIGKMTVLYK